MRTWTDDDDGPDDDGPAPEGMSAVGGELFEYVQKLNRVAAFALGALTGPLTDDAALDRYREQDGDTLEAA